MRAASAHAEHHYNIVGWNGVAVGAAGVRDRTESLCTTQLGKRPKSAARPLVMNSGMLASTQLERERERERESHDLQACRLMTGDSCYNPESVGSQAPRSDVCTHRRRSVIPCQGGLS